MTDNQLIIIGCSMIVAMIVGACLVRYGIGLGQKLTIASQNDMPIDKKMPEIMQEFTGEQ